jgi:RNA polymerase sigma-70 factor (ECF subfamily)
VQKSDCFPFKLKIFRLSGNLLAHFCIFIGEDQKTARHFQMNEIIAACQSGDRTAQKKLFEVYSKGMLMVCSRYVKDCHVAEELLLNGFYKFFKTIDRFQYVDNNSIGAWLKKIMVNECLMHLRERKKVKFVPEEYGGEVGISEAVLEKLNANEILALINELPDGYRTVFNLYVIEGFSHKEIATMLGVSEGTSKSQLSKAKVFLQKILTSKEMVYER